MFASCFPWSAERHVRKFGLSVDSCSCSGECGWGRSQGALGAADSSSSSTPTSTSA